MSSTITDRQGNRLPKCRAPLAGTCEWCKVKFTAKWYGQRFCGRKCSCSYLNENKKRGAMNKACEGCGSYFSTKRRQQRFCSQTCSCRATAARLPNIRGKTKPRVVKTCVICKTEFDVIWSRRNKAKFCSLKCTYMRIPHTKGAGSPVWAGGTTVAYYRGLVKDKLEAASCELCGLKYDRLIVHHKDRDRLNNVVDNLQVLCRVCHARVHSEEARIMCPCCNHVAHPEEFERVDGIAKVI